MTVSEAPGRLVWLSRRMVPFAGGVETTGECFRVSIPPCGFFLFAGESGNGVLIYDFLSFLVDFLLFCRHGIRCHEADPV